MQGLRVSFYACLMLTCFASASDPLIRLAEVLSNESSFNYYANCFLDKGPCTGEGRTYKRLLPDFISTACSKCSENNMEAGCRIIATLQQARHANLWQQLLQKYDSQAIHRKNLDNFLTQCKAKYNITTEN